MVVWSSYGSAGSDTSYTSIQGQRYAGPTACHDGEWDEGEFCGRDAYLVTGKAEMNHDCSVDLLDEKLFFDEYPSIGANLSGDFDGDGDVDSWDNVSLENSFGAAASPCTRGGMRPDRCGGTLALSFSDDPAEIVSTTTQAPGFGVVYVVVDGWTDAGLIEFGVESSSNVYITASAPDPEIWGTIGVRCCTGEDVNHRYYGVYSRGGEWPSGPAIFAHLDYEVLDSNPAWIKLAPVTSSCFWHSRIRWAKNPANQSIDFLNLLNVGINGPPPVSKSPCAYPEVPALSLQMSWVLSGILVAIALAVLGRGQRSRLRLPRARSAR